MAQKIVVIGAGLIGSATAAELARAGCAVQVLCDGPLGRDTSSASLSWLNAADKPPASYTRMNIMGMRRHAEYAARHGDAPWYHRGGNLRLCFDDAEVERIERMIADIAAFDYPARWLTGNELAALEPDLSPSVIGRVRAAYFPEECWINGAPLIARLLADARAEGAVVRAGARAVGFDTASGRVSAVLLEDGERISADAVVLSAGPATGRLAATAGCHVPLANEKGFQAYTAPAAVTLGRVVHSPGLNLRPDGAGRICLHDYGLDGSLLPVEGATEEEQATSAAAWRVDPAAVATLLDRLATFYPAARGIPVEAARVGMRPIPRDRRPVMGWLDGCENLYAAVMHSGATQALWAGELARREVAGAETVPDLSDFRPSRFQRTPETPEPVVTPAETDAS